ncbi:hypothetical protein BASA62_002563 [Batrachochytrium salamandrivorans]|nr:hypothetical protein BASA62_002563 [Batrachochytrium salamandrivorans]
MDTATNYMFTTDLLKMYSVWQLAAVTAVILAITHVTYTLLWSKSSLAISKGLQLVPVAQEGLPIVGTANAFRDNPRGFLSKYESKLGKVFSVDMVAMRINFFLAPSYQISFFKLTRDGDFRLEDAFYGMVRAVHHRRQGNQDDEYAIGKLDSMYLSRTDLIEAYRHLTLPMITEQILKYASADPPTVDLVEFSSSMTIRIVVMALVGERFHDKNVDMFIPLLQQFERDIKAPANTFFPKLPFPPQQRLDSTCGTFVSWVEDEIRLRIDGKETHHKDYLQQFLNGEAFQKYPKEIPLHVVAMILAAHTNTAGTMFWTLYEIAKSQTLQQRVYDELDSFGMINKSVEEQLHRVCVEKPKLLYACIKEAGRRYQTLFLFRMAVCDTEFEGYFIPKGEYVSVSQPSSSLNGEVFEDPLKFDPDRFLGDKHSNSALTGEYVQFGQGAHKCRGEKFILYSLVNAVIPTILSHTKLSVVLQGPDDTRDCDYFSTVGVPFSDKPITIRLDKL